MFKYDMHVHTSEVSPCGKVKAKDIVRFYKEIGYQGIVITDHFNREIMNDLGSIPWKKKLDYILNGYNQAFDEGQKLDLDVLLGIEIRFSGNNDYLVYGIDEAILEEAENIQECEMEEFMTFASEKDLLVYQAHPMRNGMTLDYIHLVHGLEGYNGNPRHNSRCDEVFQLAKDKKFRIISGSDYHELSDLGRGGIITKTRIKTNENLKSVLRQNVYDLITT